MQFENIVAQAAWLLYDHAGGSDADLYDEFEMNGNTHVLVDYSPVLLDNIDADTAVIRSLRDATNSTAGIAWIVVTPADTVVVRQCALTGAYGQRVIDDFTKMAEKADAPADCPRHGGPVGSDDTCPCKPLSEVQF